MRQLGKGGISAYLWRSRGHAGMTLVVSASLAEMLGVMCEKSADDILTGIKQVGELSQALIHLMRKLRDPWKRYPVKD